MATSYCVRGAALWVWHIPRLFQATLYGAELVSFCRTPVRFLGSALLFWWSLFYAHGKARYGASVIYLFTTAVHTGVSRSVVDLRFQSLVPRLYRHNIRLRLDDIGRPTGRRSDHVDSRRAGYVVAG